MKAYLLVLLESTLISFATAQSWLTSGNAGTAPGTNFLGTTDAKALMFKVNNQRSGYIDFNSQKANTSFGFRALKSGAGTNNAAFGYKTLFSNTSGFDNSAFGYTALYNNTEGYLNVAGGALALFNNTGGSFNTASGYQSLYSNISGEGNTAAGVGSGEHNDANIFCSFFGYNADQSVTDDFFNSMALGYSSRITGVNQVRIGNASISSIGGQVGWSTLSDGRMKKNMKNDVPGLKFINLLKPVTYNMDADFVASILGENIKEDLKDAEGKSVVEKENEKAKKLIQQGRAEKASITYTGFVAQEVEAAAKKIGYDFSGVDKPKNEHTLYSLRYAEFVVPLVKAVQELSQQNDAFKREIAELKSILLKENSATIVSNNVQTVTLSEASLEQNIPNPFSNSTIIYYTLPQKYSSAKIIITDKNSKKLKEVNISGRNKGSLQVDASTISNGAYNFSLYVNGKLIDTKQMVLVK